MTSLAAGLIFGASILVSLTILAMLLWGRVDPTTPRWRSLRAGGLTAFVIALAALIVWFVSL
ncbi:hypothetical protein [Cellulomonas sp. C5510]|uniref:hypothetical protein n=1 Tax=Cellulomonas sp. C5510 TaxID=2871170 RepID=UPI001C962B40|nr:hypothetical protein [Cellulomonas sp. C5510]QZN85182.1 hypothetical protein K5O09_15580 [Cellulomonas sp. C5510]